MKRTIYCGLLREGHKGTEQTCCGWVLTKRDMGGVIFIDLRDREGVLQVLHREDGPLPAGDLQPQDRYRHGGACRSLD